MMSAAAVWERCWCYRMGRCLVDCPTADLPPPAPLTDENWRRAYRVVLHPECQVCNHDGHVCPGCGEPIPHGPTVCVDCWACRRHGRDSLSDPDEPECPFCRDEYEDATWD